MESISYILRRCISRSMWVVGILLLFLIFFSSCKDKHKAQMAMPEPEISVASPEVRDITLTKDYPGYLTAEQTVNLVGRVNGVLQSANFQPGGMVRQGQVVFVIEPTLYQNAVAQAEAELKTAKAQLDYARSSYERMKEAIKSDAVSRIQYLQAESNVTEGIAAVSNAEAALKTAQTNLGYCYVKAPFDGRIDRSQFDVGSYISAAIQPVTLATVYKDNKMYTYFNVADNQWITMLLNGSGGTSNTDLPRNVTVRLGKDGVQTYPGTLDYLSPNVDLSTGTLNVRAVLDNPKGILKSGLYVSVTLPYGEQKQAVLIPDASIGTDQLGKYVYLVNDSNVVNYRHITIGQLVDGTLRQILSGVSPQDKYVTKALLKVSEGLKVKPITGDQSSNKK